MAVSSLRRVGIGALCALTLAACGCGNDRSEGGPSCVMATGAGLEPWLDLKVVGHAFHAYENMRIRATVAGGGRIGVAHDEIVAGAFELAMPRTINYSYYSEIALYVDQDRDDACGAGESLWGFVTGIVQDHLLLEVTPAELCVRGGGPQVGSGCRLWAPPPAPCFINGQTNLEMRLPCSP
jgi:hypothetical protein